ncbi:hypothetical protein WME98_40410 [Sorangium sp. So ce296]|uniref:hypothetical protein n=1 Tax=Sorangium sp. So ce296 TaxID=3133296 RepID=UPI003F5D8F06
MTNDNGVDAPDEVLSQIEAWWRQGAEFRSKLLAEKSFLQKRIREIDAALAMIPEPPGQNPVTPDEDAPDDEEQRGDARDQQQPRLPMAASAFRKLSMPQMVRAIVMDHPEGIRAPQVVDTVRLVMPKVDPALVHSGLYRALDSGEIKAEGSRGTRVYYPGEPSAEDVADE